MAAKQATMALRGEAPAMMDRRQRILAVAAQRFAASGFESTTVRQIADDVSILSGSLYHHFATKEDMLHAIVREPAEQLGARARRIASLPGSAEARVVTMIRAELAALTRDHEVHAILHNERKFFRRNPDFAYVMMAKKDAYMAWESILRDGIGEGLFDSGIDLYLTIATVIRMLNTGADWFVHEEDSVLGTMGSQDFDRLERFYIAFVLRAIRTAARVGAAVPAALDWDCESRPVQTGTSREVIR